MDPVPLPPPPVVDYARQARMAEVVESAGSTFSMFNIVGGVSWVLSMVLIGIGAMAVVWLKAQARRTAAA